MYTKNRVKSSSFHSNEATACSQWLKIDQQVAFNIASKASYVYNLSGQKFIKSAKLVHFCEVFEDLNATFLVIFLHCACFALLLA